jgi:hypothetical protein
VKVTQLLSDYLSQQHRLVLTGFGVITHDGSIQYAKDGEAEKLVFAAGSLQFQFDPKAVVEDGLITFISKETGKMRPLALSDIESYLEFGHELINISKPFHIEGLGTLQKNSNNELEFKQEEFGRSQSSGQARSGSRQRSKESERSESPYGGEMAPREKKARLDTQKLLIILVIGLGLAVSYLLFSRYQQKDPAVSNSDAPVSRKDAGTSVTPEPPKDNAANDATAPPTSAVEKPTKAVFNVVIEVSGRERALKRYADLKEWGHDIRMDTRDSLTFKLYIPINAPLADTARHRDSLRLFFNRRVWIEKIP